MSRIPAPATPPLTEIHFSIKFNQEDASVWMVVADRCNVIQAVSRDILWPTRCSMPATLSESCSMGYLWPNLSRSLMQGTDAFYVVTVERYHARIASLDDELSARPAVSCQVTVGRADVNGALTNTTSTSTEGRSGTPAVVRKSGLILG